MKLKKYSFIAIMTVLIFSTVLYGAITQIARTIPKETFSSYTFECPTDFDSTTTFGFHTSTPYYGTTFYIDKVVSYSLPWTWEKYNLGSDNDTLLYINTHSKLMYAYEGFYFHGITDFDSTIFIGYHSDYPYQGTTFSIDKVTASGLPWLFQNNTVSQDTLLYIDPANLIFKLYSDTGEALVFDASAREIELNVPIDNGLLVRGAGDDTLFFANATNGVTYFKDSGAGTIQFWNTSATVSGTKEIWTQRYLAQNDDGQANFWYAAEQYGLTSDDSGVEAGYYIVWALHAGSQYQIHSFVGAESGAGTMYINPSGTANIDFVVEWDSGNAIEVDATDGDVIIGEELLHKKEILVDTTTHTLTSTDSLMGAIFTNKGNIDADTLSLLGAVKGCHFKYILEEAQDVDINPDDSDRISACDNIGDAISSDATAGSWIEFTATSDSTWFVQYGGTWTDVD